MARREASARENAPQGLGQGLLERLNTRADVNEVGARRVLPDMCANLIFHTAL